MKNLTIRYRILGSFGLILAVIGAMAAMSYTRLSQIERQTALLQAETIPGIYYGTQVRGNGWESYVMIQKYAHADGTTKKAAEMAVTASRGQFERSMGKYQATIATADDRRLFEAVKAAQGAYFAAQQEFMQASAELKDHEAIEALLESRLRPQHLTFLAAINAAVEKNNREALESSGLVYDAIGSVKLSMVSGSIAALLLAWASGFLLFRAINRPLRKLVAAMDVVSQGDFTGRLQSDRKDEFGVLAQGFDRMAGEVMALIGHVQESGLKVSTSMNEIAATSKQQQATASEIAATTTEVGATSREISATSKELVKTMNEVAAVAEQTATLATDGQAGLSRMEETMHHVMEAAGSISAKFTVLSEKAGIINTVVTVITKVADQTNLLSLNAAIEAEKAGEYGRGFAVVASEIRRLADRTAVATYDIERMVKEIETAVSAGVMGMDKFSEEVRRGMQDVQQVGGQLSQIIQQVQALVPRFETVNDGMQTQATGAEQISEALLQLTDAVQQTVESLRQSSQAIDELNQVSGNLRSSVSQFKLEAA